MNKIILAATIALVSTITASSAFAEPCNDYSYDTYSGGYTKPYVSYDTYGY